MNLFRLTSGMRARNLVAQPNKPNAPDGELKFLFVVLYV